MSRSSGTKTRCVHLLAFDEQNDGKCGFHGTDEKTVNARSSLGMTHEHSLVQRDDQQVSKLRAQVESHLLAAPIKYVLQGNDGHEADCTGNVTGCWHKDPLRALTRECYLVWPFSVLVHKMAGPCKGNEYEHHVQPCSRRTRSALPAVDRHSTHMMT